MVEDNVAELFDFKQEKYSRSLRKEVELYLEPVAGDKVAGELPDFLIQEFCEVTDLAWKIEIFNDIMKDRVANDSKKIVRASMDQVDPAKLVELAGEITVFENDTEAYEYLKCVCIYEHRHKTLIYGIRKWMDNYTHRYDVRQGFKVVLLEKKYA